MNPAADSFALLPATQQAALRALAARPLVFRGNAGGYVDQDGTSHPVRTVRMLSRAGMVQLETGSAVLTDAGREFMEGGAQ